MWRAGLLAAVLLGMAAPCSPAGDARAVQKAIDRGVKALRAMQAGNGSFPPDAEFGAVTQTGATALAGLTLLECGAGARDEAVQRAADAVRKASVRVTHNYSTCLSILFFHRLGDPRDIALIESLSVRLLAGQTATGGWNYFSPAISEAESRRLQAHLDACRKPGGRPPAQTSAVQRTVRDLPREIQQQLALLRRAGGTGTVIGSDNSNTQLATLALWVARRYGLPVQEALKRVEARFRSSQQDDGGWGYFDPEAPIAGPMAASTASMTCAGLIALAAANGNALESAPQRRPDCKTAPAACKDPNIRKGLLALSAIIGTPAGDQGDRAGRGAAPVPWVGGRTYYFLWSVERVAVALDLKTIGKKDWYAWGAEILLANQQDDGSWQGNYGLCGADTCFALLFLKRANLAPDLTRQLSGRVPDPGEHLLKGNGPREGSALDKTRRVTSGIEDRTAKPSVDRPQPAPAATEKPLTSPAVRMGDDLANSTATRFELLIHNLRVGKGAEFTEALALAIPKLTGERQQKARKVLSERLTRMTDRTLSDYLGDELVEIRIAAARAAAAKGSKALIPRLVPLLSHSEGEVAEAAHRALEQLSGQDFGPQPGAGPDERVQAARRWLAWWHQQQ